MDKSDRIHLASLEATKFLQLVSQWWQLSQSGVDWVDVQELQRVALRQGKVLQKSLAAMGKK